MYISTHILIPPAVFYLGPTKGLRGICTASSLREDAVQMVSEEARISTIVQYQIINMHADADSSMRIYFQGT